MTHSLGDGVALARIFLELVRDDPRPMEISFYEPTWKRKIIDKLKYLSIVALLGPYKFAEIWFLKPDDKNFLHPKRLTGEKVLHWINEADIKAPLLQILKTFRRKLPNLKYNDVVAALISRAIESYFELKNETPPDHLTMILPGRVVGEGNAYFSLSLSFCFFFSLPKSLSVSLFLFQSLSLSISTYSIFFEFFFLSILH